MRLELEGSGSLGGDILTRLCALGDATPKMVELLVEIRDLMRSMDAKIAESLLKGDELLAKGDELREVGDKIHAAGTKLDETMTEAAVASK